MTSTTDLAAQPDPGGRGDSTAGGATEPGDRTVRPTRVPKLGIWAWCFVGVVIAAVIVAIVLGALSEIVLPMTFAAVLAIIFKPCAASSNERV